MIQGDSRDAKKQHQQQRRHRGVDVNQSRPLIRRPFGVAHVSHDQGV
jgi:hypothetical protein